MLLGRKKKEMKNKSTCFNEKAFWVFQREKETCYWQIIIHNFFYKDNII